MYLADLFDVWWRGVVDPLRGVSDVLQALADHEAQLDSQVDAALSNAAYHINEAIQLLQIGTEEVHTLEGARVGKYRSVDEELSDAHSVLRATCETLDESGWEAITHADLDRLVNAVYEARQGVVA